MQNADLIAKLDALDKTIQDERNKVSSNIKLAAFAYGIIVILVFGYTTFITLRYREMATPKTVAVIVSDAAKNKIPLMSGYLHEHAKTQAPAWADRGFEYLHTMVPEIEKLAKTQIDDIIDGVIKHTQDNYVPQLSKYLDEHVDRLFSNKDVVTDHKLARGISQLLVDELNREIDKVVHDKFYTKISDLRKDVEVIAAKPKERLTKKEDAERRVLLYWMFLVKYGDPGDSKFIESLKFVSILFSHFTDKYCPVDKLVPSELPPESE